MRGLKFYLTSLFITSFAILSYSQSVSLTCFPGNDIAINEVKYQKVYTNLNIPQTSRVKGYIEHLPSGYNAQDKNTQYPLVLMLHVLNEWGNGTPEDMCKFFANKYQKFPYVKIEEQTWPTTLTVGANDNRRFITLTPQFTTGSYSPVDVNNFLEYAKEKYNIDPSRVYLMGASQGANVALAFIGNSEAYAKKIAGVVAMSPCSSVSGAQAQIIKNAGVGVWVSQCNVDGSCNAKSAENTYNALRNVGHDPNKNVFSNLTSTNGCNMGNTHDSWTVTLANNFNYSTLSTPKTIYQWIGTLSSAEILPVTLKHFDAKLLNNQTWIQWETSQEINGEYFYIQRANDNMQFSTIDSVLTKNLPNGSKYQYVDANPAIGNNYYRLVQKDIDNQLQYFDIKKVSVNTNNLVTIINNPFQSILKIAIQSSSAEQYQFIIRDIQGKTFYQEKIYLQAGRRDVEVQSGNWPSGMYILSIQSNGNIQTHKLIKN